MSSPTSHRVQVIGELTQTQVAQLGASVLANANIEMTSSSISDRTEYLILGQNIDIENMRRLMPSVRVAHPALTVIAVRSSDRPADALAEIADVVVDEEQDLASCMNAEHARNHQRNRQRLFWRWGQYPLSLIVLALAWAALVETFKPAAYILPSPSMVWATFIAQPDRFFMHVSTTAFEALLGFVIGNGLGFALAIVLTRFVSMQAFTLPVLISLQAIPIVALAPLLGVWLGSGLESKIAMAAIICFFPMVVNTLQAFASVERDFLDLFALYRSSFQTKLVRLLIPASTASIIAALKISAGLAVVGAIVAEMTGADKGLGYLILNGAYRLETNVLFVAMILAAFLGMSFYFLPTLIQSLLPEKLRRAIGAAEVNHG